jgi:SnoaL-like domain
MGKEIKIDANMAMAWTPYKFYIGENFSHCGVNLFTLVKLEQDWKIVNIIDTRRRQGCEATTTEENVLQSLLDNWHIAASTANWENYFNPLSDDHIFLGTDATERWTKSQFQAFAKPYFDKGKAWDFKPYNRNILMHENGELAWFDELLETWMGTCRGSGVLQKINGNWQIKHYNLAMLVPNEKIDAYLEILNKKP